MSSKFPIERFLEIEKNPHDFRLLQRVPLCADNISFGEALTPHVLNEPVGDELELLVVDVETTGLKAEDDAIIELGVVRASYSPSAKRMTAILDVYSGYEDPGRPIPEVITEITGISDQDVAGQSIDTARLDRMVGTNDPLLIAHNAAFDRAFMDKRFPGIANLRWGCTMDGIPWKELGFEGRKLEYLLLTQGWFYQGHRAATDCLATAWLLAQRPEAFAHLLESVENETVVVRAFGSPYETKDKLSQRGYRWHPGDMGSNKCWWTEIPAADLEAEQVWLNNLYHNGAERAAYQFRNARNRYSSPVA